ncbi:hypothetical protein C0993_008451 [Termitomyces sp. T159_Od127]|nr:hypothetical protein C0993_008451 [Termitomyces sp. T159_Od127]
MTPTKEIAHTPTKCLHPTLMDHPPSQTSPNSMEQIFSTLKNRVLIAAHVHGAKGYLEGTIPCPDPPANPEADKKPLRKATKSPVKPVNTREQAIATTIP